MVGYFSVQNRVISGLTGADTGFPVVGGANPRGGGAPTYDFAKFSEKPPPLGSAAALLKRTMFSI